MSTLTSYTSANRPSASSNTGLCIFRSDTDAIEVSDGTDWQTYNSDGVFQSFPSNSYSGSFDGVGDSFSISNLSGNLVSTAYSLGAWVKTNGSTGASLPIFGSGIDSNRTMLFWVDGSLSQFRAVSRSSGGAILTSGSTYTMTNWNHVVYTVSSSGTGKFYVNGTPDGSTSQQLLNAQSVTNLAIGRRNFGNIYFPGFIDEAFVFNRELTATEVSNIYSNKSYESLLALYRFENNANDESGNYNATNNGVTFSTSDKPY